MSPRFRLVSAVHLFLLQGGQVLVLRRHQTGYEDGNYSVVAGHLEGNETVVAAAVREAREEVGIELAPQDVHVVGVMHRRSTDERVDWFATCERWTGAVRNAEPAKCDDLRWVNPEALPSNTIPYVRRAIENYRSGRWFDSFGWD
jgi:8-oxo-dGTP pyrophosphatase MutT (NUDIX family)